PRPPQRVRGGPAPPGSPRRAARRARLRRLRPSPDRGRRDAPGAARAPPRRRCVGRVRAAQRHGLPRAASRRLRARVRRRGSRAPGAPRQERPGRRRPARSRTPRARARDQGEGHAERRRYRRAHRRRSRPGRHGRALFERRVRGDSPVVARGALPMTEADALQSIDSSALVRVALMAAREAGALVKAAWRKHPTAEHKGRTDLVTRFDRESETLLIQRLTAATPYPVVGEEHGGERAAGTDALTWYVDPIDGPTNFVHGHPFWCVSVGLLAGTRPVLGAVVAPSLGTEWIGVAAGQGTRSGERCRVSDVSTLDDALLATGLPYDGYWENKLKPWDVAAGVALVLAAGGRVSDYSGRAADVTTGQIVATNGHVHDALLAELELATKGR